MRKWRALVVLSLAQFLMVLDSAVMNVSISQLVEDFDTTVTTIQAVITFYALVMAATMITGGRIGDILGRRNAFAIGLAIYATGSMLTALSWNVGVLLFGWSILEGLGAALVLPAMVALIASNYEGPDRVTAFGVIGGVAGVGIAAGPIIGGYFTANLSWRWVFVGEVIVAIIIIATHRLVTDSRVEGPRPRLDIVGAVLSALGLGMIVIATLQASNWGWIRAKDSPIEPFGLALTPFVAVGGVLVLMGFVAWQERREARGEDPLVRLQLLQIPALRSGLNSLLSQNLILLGIFFTLPLYLQVVLGFDALETGIRMLPISISMFIASALGPMLTPRVGSKRVVQAGFVLLVVAALSMLETVDFRLDSTAFAVALTILGVGMGLIASQLGHVVQSSVKPEERSEAGGLQFTAQQLGSAMGTALIGAVVMSVLTVAFVDEVKSDERVPTDLATELEASVSEGASFVSSEAVAAGLADAGVGGDEVDAIVEGYEDAQLESLKIGLFLAAALGALALMGTRHLPGREEQAAAEAALMRPRPTRRELVGRRPLDRATQAPPVARRRPGIVPGAQRRPGGDGHDRAGDVAIGVRCVHEPHRRALPRARLRTVVHGSRRRGDRLHRTRPPVVSRRHRDRVAAPIRALEARLRHGGRSGSAAPRVRGVGRRRGHLVHGRHQREIAFRDGTHRAAVRRPSRLRSPERPRGQPPFAPTSSTA